MGTRSGKTNWLKGLHTVWKYKVGLGVGRINLEVVLVFKSEIINSLGTNSGRILRYRSGSKFNKHGLNGLEIQELKAQGWVKGLEANDGLEVWKHRFWKLKIR